MDERTRYILAMTDAELLMFHSIGGDVPPLRRQRLAKILGKVCGELAIIPPPPKELRSGPPMTYPKRYAHQKPHDKRRRLARRRQRLRYAA
jgi:hypothetical protein